MSSEECAIRVSGVGKCYPVYARPADRLRQFVMPRVRGALRLEERRYFEEYWALRNVDFEVRKGEQIGIVGRNGAGKSTLLQIICGTLSPTTGDVTVAGRIAALLELGAGFNPELTGSENIFLYGSVLGLSEAEIKGRYDDIIAFADIPGFIDQPVKHYSSGMYMRLAFAVAVHVQPDILVVDEALSVGDEAYQRKCHARIRALRDEGATILFVSHSAGHVTEVCDRALLLDRGELIAIGRAKDVIASYQKMLYAPAGQQDVVRSAIVANGRADSLPDQAETKTVRIDEEWWDDGLVPNSTVAYPPRGCRILDVGIETLDGRQVNVLLPNAEDVYRYRAEFDEPATGVRFGMMVRSLTGVELAGAASHPEGNPIAFVARGSSIDVRFRFRNLLNAGTYFLNAGIVGLEGEGETFLVRYLDVAMFRVTRDPLRLATGFTDICAEPEVVFR
jgi:lipopolysaccharide transport system ATP-binding protein